jgi:hypothetical protein
VKINADFLLLIRRNKMGKDLSYKINIDGDIGNIESKLSNLRNMLSRLTANGDHPEMSKMFDTIGKSLDKLKTKAS